MQTITFSYRYNRKNKLNKNGQALVQLMAYKRGTIDAQLNRGRFPATEAEIEKRFRVELKKQIKSNFPGAEVSTECTGVREVAGIWGC